MAVGPVAQIHISVTDMDRSVTFYRDVLGIPLLFEVPGQPMAFFASGDVRLYLGVPERAEFASRCLLYFRVDAADAAQQPHRHRVQQVGDLVPVVGRQAWGTRRDPHLP